MLGFAVGCVTATCGAIMLAGRSDAPGLAVAWEVQAPVRIHLLTPRTIVGEAVNVFSGSMGYSHTAIELGEFDAVCQPLCVDAHVGRGVHRRLLSWYCGVPRATLVIANPIEAAEFRGACRALVGMPYGQPHCGSVVARCLPARLRAMLPARDLDCTPNHVAIGLGARAGEEREI